MRTIGFIVLLALPAAAQTVVGVASRTVSVIAEEAYVDVNVVAAREVPLDTLLRTLEPTGVRREHLTSVSLTQTTIGRGGTTAPAPPGPVALPLAYTYQFSFVAAPGEIAQVVERFQEFGRTPPPGVLTWSAAGSLGSSDAALEVARISQLPLLFADARRRADQWRLASGAEPSTVVFLADTIAPQGQSQVLPALAVAVQVTGPPGFALARGTTATFSLNLRLGAGPRLVSATASKLVTLAPEETTFRVMVTAQPGVTSAQVVDLLTPAGFTADDLQTVDSRGFDARPELPPGAPQIPVPPQPSTATFDLVSTRTASETDAVLRALDQLQRIPRPGIVSIQFGAGMGVSTATVDLLRKNVVPELLETTRRKAGDLARLMNGRLGSLVTYVDGPPALGGGGFSFIQLPLVPSNLRILTTVAAQYTVE